MWFADEGSLPACVNPCRPASQWRRVALRVGIHRNTSSQVGLLVHSPNCSSASSNGFCVDPVIIARGSFGLIIDRAVGKRAAATKRKRGLPAHLFDNSTVVLIDNTGEHGSGFVDTMRPQRVYGVGGACMFNCY
jgi:hypothetical protein